MSCRSPTVAFRNSANRPCGRTTALVKSSKDNPSSVSTAGVTSRTSEARTSVVSVVAVAWLGSSKRSRTADFCWMLCPLRRTSRAT